MEGPDQKIQYLKGVGEKRAQLFAKLGVFTVNALLRFYPRAYEDWSQVVPVAQAPLQEVCCLRGVLMTPMKEHFIRKGMVLYKGDFSDDSGVLHVTLFNNRYLAQTLVLGKEYLLYGKVGGTLLRREMASPQIEPASKEMRLRPVYRQTEKLSSRIIETCVRNALAGLDDKADPLPPEMRREFQLCTLEYALRNIHFPLDDYALRVARRRLIFEELFVLQLGMLRMKGQNKQTTEIRLLKERSEEFFRLLPFTPTAAQKRAVGDAVKDMMSGIPMSRLVQGDVGSGKTAVAAAVAYNIIKDGWQCAMMAPTEILAQQHFHSLSPLLEPAGIRLGLLTGSTPAAEKRALKKALAEGALDFVVGTHALLQETVSFARLGLVVTDEQHRFGVEQRAALAQKGEKTHLLVMSATPIPRTLGLIIYGDLDISILDELPPGRQPIRTYCVNSSYHPRLYRFVRKYLDQGHQAYIVCPLVEEGETDLIPAETYAHELAQGAFQGCRVGLLHGKMKPKEKDAVMRAFSSGEIQLLVSTTVVEVGVDVPNAVVMVIENADRFGLSQLHQLRGRVGRGKTASTCVLVTDAQGEVAKQRMQILCETTDGFRIAEEDLKMRGPGDFFGSRQHGLPDLKIANLMEDMETLRLSGKAAKRLLNKDPCLELPENKPIREEVEALFQQAGEGTLN